MTTIQRGKQVKGAFRVGLNVTLDGSKKMTPVEQEAALTVEKVRVLIVDADDPTNVLLDTTANAKEFSTGSIGYGVNVANLAFPK